MPADPILTLGDLEPERPLVAINRNAPDGRWQRFKHRHFDVLLRWFPVRYLETRELYPIRLRSEFGLAALAKLDRLQADASALMGKQDDPAALKRMVRLVRQCSGLILDAPSDVLDALTFEQHLKLLMTFPAAVTGRMPQQTTTETESPSTSDDSSPASAASTPATSGATG
jgi:hypothetical protein